MKDRVITYAIAVSVLAHMVVIGVVGRTSAAKLNAATAVTEPRRFIKVDFVGDPFKTPAPKPIPAARNTRPVPTSQTPTDISSSTRQLPAQPSHVSAPARARSIPGNPGGKLNVGSTSSSGDLPGNWSGGKTPVGWVPGDDHGKGAGSGSGSGVGRPDPPRNVDDGPGTRPAPAPPPPPRMVSVRVCDESGLLSGDNCKRTRTESFKEGDQPTRICNKCEPEHKSRLADQAKPILVKDSRPSIPSSVPEGLNVTVSVEYTITEDGDVRDVKVVASSGCRALDQACVRAAQELKYKPAVQDGVPRSVKKTRDYKVRT